MVLRLHGGWEPRAYLPRSVYIGGNLHLNGLTSAERSVLSGRQVLDTWLESPPCYSVSGNCRTPANDGCASREAIRLIFDGERLMTAAFAASR